MKIIAWLVAGIATGVAAVALLSDKTPVPGLESDGSPLSVDEELALMQLEASLRSVS